MKQTESHVLPGTGERFLPEFDGSIVAEHLHRYHLARHYAAGLSVLDIACGEGYGSSLLAEVAEQVIGVDISEETIEHAASQYPRKNLSFRTGDCAAIPLEDQSIDLVVSFETIEHHDQHQEMLAEIRRVLKPDGVLIISSPDHYQYSTARNFDNPYHVHELERDEFETLIARHFTHFRMLGQRVVHGSAIFSDHVPEEAMRHYSEQQSEGQAGLVNPMYWIALASNQELPELADSFYDYPVENSDVVLSLVSEQKRSLEDIQHRDEAIKERDGRIEAMQKALSDQTEAIEALQEQLAESELSDSKACEHREALEEVIQTHAQELQAKSQELQAQRELEENNRWLHGAWFQLNARIQSPKWLLRQMIRRLAQLPGERRHAQAERQLIAQSGLFDAEWYRQHNADVHALGLDPLEHYHRHGGFEGRAASSRFDTAFWLRQHPEIVGTRQHPMLHYLEHQQPGIVEQGSAGKKGSDRLFGQLFADASQPSDTHVELQDYHLQGDTRIRAIAYYLPQFHPIDENNRWWGKGFTEWTNVTKAVPQFVGHEQPRLPGELGFYDLRLPEVQERQVELARQHGLEAFCFHYYWFSGRKRLLETPIDNYVANDNIDFPFCLCWANENWTRRWDGQENDILMAQLHRPEDDLEFIEDLAPLLRDPRYLRVDGKAVLIVYRVDILPDAAKTASVWRQYCREQGLGELHLVAAQTFGTTDPRPYGFDAAVEYPPHDVQSNQIEGELEFINPDFSGRVFDYREVVANQLAKPSPEGYWLHPTVFPAWDNEARKPGRGHVFHRANPGDYRRWLEDACQRADEREGDNKLVFINAWNEWAEGAYLEPDRRYGYAYLRATQEVLAQHPRSHDVPEDIRALSKASRQHDTAVILHLFYPELWSDMLPWIQQIPDGCDLYVTLPQDADAQTEARLARDWPDVRTARVPNRGRDVAPFVEVVRATRSLGYCQICKIHAKKSVHRGDGDSWRQEMLGALLGSPEQIARIQKAFRTRDTLGLVGPAGHWLPYTRYWGICPESPARVRTLLKALDDHQTLESMQFFAGSMFWCRPEALDGLLGIIGWQDFETELGQVDGALGHAIERILARAIQHQGYTVADTQAPERQAPEARRSQRYPYAAVCPPLEAAEGGDASAQWPGARARLRQLLRRSTLARRLRKEILSRIS